MLTGYTVECALKGLWVRAGRKLIASQKFIRIPDAGDHELRQIAVAVSHEVELPLTETDLKLLDRLSAFVRFAGRYPVPLRHEEMRPVQSLDGGEQVPHVFTAADFQEANRLLNGFTTALDPVSDVFRRQKESLQANPAST